MWDAAGDAAAVLEHALGDFFSAVGGAAPGWMAAGVALHLANQVMRGRGWYAVLRTAGTPLRRRDAIAAWVAGAGAGGVASARGGDAVRVLLLRRRLPDAGCPVLAGTLVAEGAGEAAVSAALLALALAIGVGPQLGEPASFVLLAAAGAVLLAIVAVRHVPRLRRVAAGVGRGCAPLRCPVAYARDVLPWQLASRACRFGALACFLAAFGLPVTPAAVLLVMFAQGSGRLVPFAPASVGAGAALLAATFGSVVGTAVPAERVAACFVGTSAVLTAVGTVLTLGLCAWLQASAKQGRSPVERSLEPVRATAVPIP